ERERDVVRLVAQVEGGARRGRVQFRLGQGQAVPVRLVRARDVHGFHHEAGVVVAGVDRVPGVVGGRRGPAVAAFHAQRGGPTAGQDAHLLRADDDDLTVGEAGLAEL